MKKKSTKKEIPTPESDPIRQQNVLLEKIGSDVKTIAEGHSVLDRKIDKIDSELSKVKEKVDNIDHGLTKVKSELNSVQIAVMEIDSKVDKLDKKLDTVTQDHEERLKKLEAVS